MQLPSSTLQFLESVRSAKQSLVLATGVFDLLHQEHLTFLTKAAQAGDKLLVAIESDVRVRKIKGKGRPVNSQLERKTTLEQLKMVDHVLILPEDFFKPADHEAFIAAVRPQVLAISSHSPHQEAKKSIVKKYGGQLKIVHQHNPNVSTTLLLQNK